MRYALQRQYDGYQKTEVLWVQELDGINQFGPVIGPNPFDIAINKKYRLGHLVEYFYRYALDMDESLQCVEQNLQFFNKKRTIGEIDFLIRSGIVIHHVELVYKFYLFDSNVGHTALEHWVGPNRKDALVNKLDKIKSVQFPLIRNSQVSQLLELKGYNVDQIEQSVCFKGQLFVPFGEFIDAAPLNQDCIVGWYLNFDSIDKFKDFMFYIPSKLNWLVAPFTSVLWISYSNAKKEIEELIKNQRSPMIWVKRNHLIQKGIIVWW
ncbi:DUF1853 family protein [Crocinitomicaceae bacterium]|nr:DUF1853 family protein [Crocinitomicaceae bacterium]